jgi:hypothetical protein
MAGEGPPPLSWRTHSVIVATTWLSGLKVAFETLSS